MAAPKYIDVTTRAYEVQRDAIANGVREGLQTQFAAAVINNTGAFPVELDAAPVGACVLQGDLTELCFSTVLQYGVTQNWNKEAANQYRHTPTGSLLTYNQVEGSFE